MTDNQELVDIDEQKTPIETSTSLNDCSPINSLEESVGPTANPIIRRPNREEAFNRTGDPVKLACVIERHKDDFEQYAGESYHPVAAALQAKTKKALRIVAFHPCVSQTGAKFILPQKLQLAHTQDNSWTSSLAEALCTPPGQWLRIWSNRELQRYEFETVVIDSKGEPTYSDFQQDLEISLRVNIIDSLDHPVLQSLMDSKSSHNGWEALNYDV